MGSSVNTGLNPVSDLLWGRNVSRLLVHFSHDKIKSMVEDRTYPDISKLHHRLRMTNAGSLDMSELHKVYSSQIDNESKRRASSFDLIFFLLPEEWDAGKGFDYHKNYLNTEYYDKNSYDYTLYKLSEGANWFNSRNGHTWKEETPYTKTRDGLIDFYIKADNPYVPSEGGEVVFTYYCECNGNFNNVGLNFRQLNHPVDNPCEIGDAIYFAKDGQICHTDEQKNKYCTYIQVPVKVRNTTSDTTRKHTFRLDFTIGDKTYQSNPYTVMQLGLKEEYYPKRDDGVYSTATLEDELMKYENGEDSIVIGKQHFDVGNENISLDITDIFNRFITGELENHGIGIAYSPTQEYSHSLYENYIGILTNKTNSFFEPYVETTYDECIHDDRTDFVMGKDNRLYLYAQIGGNLVNLDEMPTCSVEGTEYEVKQQTRGIYYIDIKLPISSYTAPTMLYDTWDNIIYHGTKIKAVELDFTTKSPYSYFGVGTSLPEKNSFTPTCYGISDNEKIRRGDVRKLCFLVNKKYEKDRATMIDGVYARLYVMDGTAQVDVIPYMEVNRALVDMYMMVDTSILIPETYYVDVKINYGMESIEHHDVLHFSVVDDTNNKYE